MLRFKKLKEKDKKNLKSRKRKESWRNWKNSIRKEEVGTSDRLKSWRKIIAPRNPPTTYHWVKPRILITGSWLPAWEEIFPRQTGMILGSISLARIITMFTDNLSRISEIVSTIIYFSSRPAVTIIWHLSIDISSTSLEHLNLLHSRISILKISSNNMIF